MAYILFLLALLALIAGVWLWIADSRERRLGAHREPDELESAPAPPTAARAEAAESAPAPKAPEPAEDPAPDALGAAEPEVPEVTAVAETIPAAEQSAALSEPSTGSTRWEHSEEVADNGPAAAPLPVDKTEPEGPEAEPEPEPETEPTSELDPKPEGELEPAPEPALAPEPASPTPTPRPHRKSGLQLPGASRRERKTWAEARGFEFAKSDDLLAGEWQRGAAAAGAAVKDVVSGQVYGHDMHLADLGRTTVIAMGTGESSDVVVDMRRAGFTGFSSADLLEVEQVEGFTVFGTEAGPVARFIDVRVRTALGELPAEVAAVWCESAWVIAELGTGTAPAQWDAVLAPLALLADAARTLPPSHSRPLELPFPARQRVAEVAAPPVEERPAGPPKVQRPEDPLEMPTRTTGTVRGPVSRHAIGGDEIAPIADPATRGAAGAQAGGAADGLGDLTRVRRKLTPPSIFDNASENRENKETEK